MQECSIQIFDYIIRKNDIIDISINPDRSDDPAHVILEVACCNIKNLARTGMGASREWLLEISRKRVAVSP